jgi:AsmA-like C-terminal region
MSRALRISLIVLGSIVLLLGLLVLYIDSELKPEPLGKRVAILLAEAKIKGGISKVQAALDGTFSAEGVDLTLENGTQIKVAAVEGKINILSTVFSTLSLDKIEVKNIEVDLSHPVQVPSPKGATTTTKSQLPKFTIGSYSITGRATLADDYLVRFSLRGDSFDSSGHIDLRAGIAWPGFTIGANKTSPRAEITLKADLQRPLGGESTRIDSLLKDFRNIDLHCVAKDDSPLNAGSMTLDLAGARNNESKLNLNGTLRDTFNHAAAQLNLTEIGGKINGMAQFSLDPKKLGVLSDSLPACAISGKLEGELDALSGQWYVKTDSNLAWSNLSRYSKAIKSNTKSEWAIKAEAKKSEEGLTIQSLSIEGNGINLSLVQPLYWKPGQEIKDTKLNCVARQAPLITLNPLLSFANLSVTDGQWSGEAEISLVKGEPQIKTIQPHRFQNLTIERNGKVLVQGITVDLPVRAEGTTIFFAPLKVSCPSGVIASGEASINYSPDGSGSAIGNLNIGIAELATQPGWEDLSADQLRGVRASTQFQVSLDSKQSITVKKLESKIIRQNLELLQIKLRQPYVLNEPKPTGVLLELTATKLPLESLGALVPGLTISGSLDKAELVAGFKADGLFIRTEGAPVSFIDTTVGWKNKIWVKHCDLAASIDLFFGEKSSTMNFSHATLKNRTRTLAEGDCMIGLGQGSTSVNLTGNLGAIAEQPFGEAISNIATGNYQVKASFINGGEISTSAKVTDLSFKDRPAKIKNLAFIGQCTPNTEGLTAEGRVKMEVDKTSEGKVSIIQKVKGPKTDWKVNANFESIQGDDLLQLLAKGTDENIKPAKKNTQADRSPLWYNHTGNIQLSIKHAVLQGIQIENLAFRVDATDNQVALSKVEGKFAGGTLAGSGQCVFKPSTTGGPYNLTSNISLKQFDFGIIATAFPALSDFIQGKGDAVVTAEGVGPNCDQLLEKLNLKFNLLSKDGRIQAFGKQNSAMSLTASKAGETANLLGGIAILAGALTKNQAQGEKIAKVGAAITTVGKLQKSLSQFNYKTAEVEILRLTDGTLKINKTLIKNDVLSFTASGKISADRALSMMDWPLNIKADLRGTGEYKDYFTVLGFANNEYSTDGLTQGPGVEFTGSINNLKNDLQQRLQAAINNIQSGLNSANQNPAPVTPTTTNPNNIVPKKLNPLESILGR